jgi:outer membrane biosynthesis protein TonB
VGGTLRSGGPSDRFVMPAAPPPLAVNPATLRRGRGRSILVLFLVLVVAAAGAGAAFVHFKVMPLAVAVVWLKPAPLAIASDPPGATVKLDGLELPDKTPLRTEVKRDRVEHTLEFTRPGSLPARATMRFDRTVPLSQSVTLTAEPPPPPPPEPVPVPEPVAEPEAPPPPPVEAKAEPKVETKAAKRAAKAAAKQAKLEAKREAKRAAAKKSKKAKASKAKSGKAKPSAEPDSEL